MSPNLLSDQARLRHLATRDGIQGTRDFARRCVRIYRRTCLDRKNRYGRNYPFRRQMVESFCFHRQYLQAV